MTATRPEQLELFCPACAGSRAVVADVPDHRGQAQRVPVPCPVCVGARPVDREDWLAVVALGRRLGRW